MSIAPTPSPPLLEPSKPDEIVVAGVLLPNSGVLLAINFFEFLVNLGSENSGKTTGCLLKEKTLREKHKKDGSKSCRSKSKKDSAREEAQMVP